MGMSDLMLASAIIVAVAGFVYGCPMPNAVRQWEDRDPAIALRPDVEGSR